MFILYIIIFLNRIRIRFNEFIKPELRCKTLQSNLVDLFFPISYHQSPSKWCVLSILLTRLTTTACLLNCLRVYQIIRLPDQPVISRHFAAEASLYSIISCL